MTNDLAILLAIDAIGRANDSRRVALKESLAQVAAARDRCGERISQIATEVSALGKQPSHLAGIIEAHTENHHRPK